MSEVLYLRFPDEATALQVAGALAGKAGLAQLPKDGWLDGSYYNIDVVGTIFDMTTNPPAPLPGFHVNGWWHGPGPLPEMLQSYRVFPDVPARVWG